VHISRTISTEGKVANDAVGGDVDVDLETWCDEHGCVLDMEVLKDTTPNWQKYRLARDSRTVLIN